jgi:hypothetical protein
MDPSKSQAIPIGVAGPPSVSCDLSTQLAVMSLPAAPLAGPVPSGSGPARSATRNRPRPAQRCLASPIIRGLTSTPTTSAPWSSSHCACAPDPQPASSTTEPFRSLGTSARNAGRSRSPLKGPSSVVDDQTAVSRSYASRVLFVCSAWSAGLLPVTGRFSRDRRDGSVSPDTGCPMSGLVGRWLPYPAGTTAST